MWPILAEFHSASSEGSWRIKKMEEEEDRIALKSKSTDDYVGRPNNWEMVQDRHVIVITER